MKKYVDIRERRKIPWIKISLTLTGLLVLGILGLLIYHFQVLTMEQVGISALVLAVSCVLSLIFHEIGHLVTGLLSGYTLVFLRLGVVAVVPDEETRFGFRVEKSVMAEGFGQCLMCPPQEEDYHDVPYELFLRGGGIGNLVSIPISLVFLIFFWSHWYVIAGFSFVALLFALSALLPLRIDGRPNDGYIKRLCDKTWEDHASFLNQLYILSAYAEGTSVGEMPETWFYGKFDLSERLDSNPLDAAIWMATADRFLIHGELFQAKIIYETLANHTALAPLTQQNGMYRFLYTMILEGRVEEVRIHPIPKFMKRAMKKLVKKYVLFPRYHYGYAMLVTESGKKMKEATGKFEKIAVLSQLEGMIADERLLMERLEEVEILR